MPEQQLIEAAYKALVKLYHPDVYKGDKKGLKRKIIEINEAFAGQAVACIKDLDLDVEKVNVNGGAVGLGHPLAATGKRLVLTLAHELHRCGGRYGVATACIGGGQGIAMVIEAIM